MNRSWLPLSLGVFAAFVLVGLPSGCKKRSSTSPPSGRDLSGAKAAHHHTARILSFGPRPPGSSALHKTRQYITTELSATGWQVGSQSVSAHAVGRGPVTFVNLIARFGTADDPELWKRPVKGLLAAHIDSKYYPDRKFLGADDAASAVGAILELARDLAQSPELASGLELVFFDGEEAFGPNISPTDGLYGSREYARRWQTAPTRPEFGILLDMIGHKNLRIRYPADSPPALVKALTAAASAEGVAERFTIADNPIIDDHVPLNNAGIPTIDIIGDFSQFAWWHTESDNLANLSEESLAITLRVTRRMLDGLLAK